MDVIDVVNLEASRQEHVMREFPDDTRTPDNTVLVGVGMLGAGYLITVARALIPRGFVASGGADGSTCLVGVFIVKAILIAHHRSADSNAYLRSTDATVGMSLSTRFECRLACH